MIKITHGRADKEACNIQEFFPGLCNLFGSIGTKHVFFYVQIPT